MLSFTRKTDYALVALAGLACEAPMSVSAHELARRLKLPLAALRNILKQLGQHGLVISAQGATGGYRLARAAECITLAEIVQAVQGPVRLALCCPADTIDGNGDHVCLREDGCRIKAAVRGLHQNLVAFLDQVSLAEIAAEDGRTNLEPRTVALPRSSPTISTFAQSAAH